MAKLTKTRLNRIVQRYIRNGDKETAKNYIKTWGKQIKDYDIQEALTEVDNPIKKETKPKKEENIIKED